MSLIHDALRRAQEAQKETPPNGPQPQLPPAEAPRASRLRVVGIAILVLAGVAILGVVVSRFGGAAAPSSTPAVPAQTVEFHPASDARVPTPDSSRTPAPSESAPSPASAPQENPSPIPETNSAPAEPALPPPPRIQAIFFAPPHSTVLIGGKSFREGDQAGEFRISSITSTSATLVSATQTNVQTLSEQ